MSGFAAISVNPRIYPAESRVRMYLVGQHWVEVPQIVWDLFWTTFYGQHRGPAFGGIASYTEDEDHPIMIRTHQGPFREGFERDTLGFEGTLAVGCTSDSTRQPLLIEESPFGPFAISFDGNVVNRSAILEEFRKSRRALERADDIAILARLIASGDDLIDGFRQAAEKVQGAFVVTLLSQQGIYIAQSPSGHKPAVIGRKDGAVAVVSESCQLSNTGFKLVGDLEPGQVVCLQNGELKSLVRLGSHRIAHCSFEHIYTQFATSRANGVSASLVRKRLGAKHAKRDIQAGFVPDIVIPVPDSGRFHAIGYLQAWIAAINAGKIRRIPLYDELLAKYPYARRSFTPATQEERNREAKFKLLPSSESLLDIIGLIEGLIQQKLVETDGKVIVIHIVVCDDSIVRGTQTANDLVPKLKSLIQWINSEVKVEIKIHFRISNPELLSVCRFGKSTKAGDNLAAVDQDGRRRSPEQIAENLGAASVAYNTIADLVEATGIPLNELCVACDKLPKR